MKKKIILGILAVLVAIAGFFAYKLFKPAVSNKKDTYFYIKTGEDVAAVKKTLIDSQYISGSNFDLVCKLLKYKQTKPGRYKLNRNYFH